MSDYRILRDGELEVTFRDEEVSLLKKLVPEFRFWLGASETPNGIELTEDDDVTLGSMITQIGEA